MNSSRTTISAYPTQVTVVVGEAGEAQLHAVGVLDLFTTACAAHLQGGHVKIPCLVGDLVAPGEIFALVGESVFPFLRTLGSHGSAYASHMKDARFTIPKAELLAKVVDLLDAVPMADRDTKGDIYEYMLGRLVTAGTNGQFRTPRHIIELMVAMTEPVPTDVMADPACGTCGFPVAVGVGCICPPKTARRDQSMVLCNDLD